MTTTPKLHIDVVASTDGFTAGLRKIGPVLQRMGEVLRAGLADVVPFPSRFPERPVDRARHLHVERAMRLRARRAARRRSRLVAR